VPEVEPNGTPDEATVLPKEQVGCGVFGEVGDVDVFVTDVDEEGWLSVAVAAWAFGSEADPRILLTGPEGAGVIRGDDLNTQDASLLFPGVPGEWVVTLDNQKSTAGDGAFYSVSVSTAKAPIEWDFAEVEPNDGNTTAQELSHGDSVFGDRHSNLDVDWYRIEVPEDKHTVTIDVEAFAWGSGGDFSIFLFDGFLAQLPENCIDCEFRNDPNDLANPDPLVVYTTEGPATLYFNLTEVGFLWGPPSWYVVRVSVEGA
jgi:hypothetical protein